LTKGIDWLSALDLKRALINCHKDFLGDWYRDPWGWPELDWIVEEGNEDVFVRRLNSEGIVYAARINVAKENFGIRPAIIIDPIDRLIYQALVDSLSRQLIGDLHPSVYGWRLPRKDARKGKYAEQNEEWDLYRAHLTALGFLYRAALKTDIVACFASVSVRDLGDDILERRPNAVSERLVSMLLGFDSIHGRSGLAQRSAASAVLANFYLRPIDEVLDAYRPVRGLAAHLTPYGRAVRWMDDIWVLGTEGRLRRAQVDLQERMLELGLDMNLGKTKVLTGGDAAAEINRIEHSAVDAGLNARERDAEPLNELIDRILDNPAQADRTSVRFATIRMRNHEVYDRVSDFVESAKQMPHASDAVARLFRDSEEWRNLKAWYVDYAQSPWGRIDWSVAQFGTMFPSNKSPGRNVADFLADSISTTTSQAIASLASQRLASWSPNVAKEIIREAARGADNPILRRTLALSGIKAGLRRSEVRPLLTEFRENAVTLSMLTDRNFRAPKVKRDFEGT
jgi:hypothetical protein